MRLSNQIWSWSHLLSSNLQLIWLLNVSLFLTHSAAFMLLSKCVFYLELKNPWSVYKPIWINMLEQIWKSKQKKVSTMKDGLWVFYHQQPPRELSYCQIISYKYNAVSLFDDMWEVSGSTVIWRVFLKPEAFLNLRWQSTTMTNKRVAAQLCTSIRASGPHPSSLCTASICVMNLRSGSRWLYAEHFIWVWRGFENETSDDPD